MGCGLIEGMKSYYGKMFGADVALMWQVRTRSFQKALMWQVHQSFPKTIGVLELVSYIHSKDDRHKSKKIPLSPQVHTADIPRDLRTHMEKSA